MNRKIINHGYYNTELLAVRGGTTLEKNIVTGELSTYLMGYYILPVSLKNMTEKQAIKKFLNCEI